MALPVDLGTVSYYAGNPATLILTFEDVDYTNSTFRSQIRRSPSADGVVEEWAVSAPVLVDGDTQVTLTLTGDPAIGNNTGQTRNLIGSSYFDVERLVGSVPTETMATAKLSITQDVTR